MYKEEKIVELIIKSFSRDIPPEESVMIKTWVSENAQNRNYYSELINVWQVSHPAFSPDLIDTDKAAGKVMGQIEDKKTGQDFFICVVATCGSCFDLSGCSFFGLYDVSSDFQPREIDISGSFSSQWNELKGKFA
jgi:hypothetical protein